MCDVSGWSPPVTGMQQCAGRASAYIIVAQGSAMPTGHEPRPIEPRATGGVVMDVDMAMAQLDCGMLAAD